MELCVQIVAVTAYMPNGVKGLKSYCAEHNLDPKTPLAFARFWRAKGEDPSLFFHLGVSVNSSVNALCEPYGLLVSQPAQDQWLVYGSLASWGHFFSKKKENQLTLKLASKLKGMGFYELLS